MKTWEAGERNTGKGRGGEEDLGRERNTGKGRGGRGRLGKGKEYRER